MVTRVKDAGDQALASAKHTPAENGSPLLPHETLKKLYALMLKSRMMTDARGCSPSSRIHPPDTRDLAHGFEATEASTVIELSAKDTVVLCQREAAVRIVAGESIESVLGRSSGKRRAPSRRGGIHIVAPKADSNTRLSMATGAALAYQLLRRRNVVLALVHGSPKEGVLPLESLNFAAAQRLPIVYVLVTDTSAQSSDLASGWPDANVLPTIIVDGNDPVAVLRVAHEAVDHAREGGGPTIIECRTRHWKPAGEDHEAVSGDAGDPISYMEHYLSKRQLWSEEWKNSLVDECEREIQEAQANAPRGTR